MAPPPRSPRPDRQQAAFAPAPSSDAPPANNTSGSGGNNNATMMSAAAGGAAGGAAPMVLSDDSGDDPSSPAAPVVLMEGLLLKRGSRVPTKKYWNERYFVLRGNVLSYWSDREEYYASAGAVKPRGTLALGSDCSVGDIYIYQRNRKGGSGSGSGKGGGTGDNESVYDSDGDDTMSVYSQGGPPPTQLQGQGGPSTPQKRESRVSVYRSKFKKKRKDKSEKKEKKEKEKKEKEKEKKEEKKERKEKEKERLYCFKISWLETSSAKGGAATTSVDTSATSAGAVEASPSFDNAVTCVGCGGGGGDFYISEEDESPPHSPVVAASAGGGGGNGGAGAGGQGHRRGGSLRDASFPSAPSLLPPSVRRVGGGGAAVTTSSSAPVTPRTSSLHLPSLPSLPGDRPRSQSPPSSGVQGNERQGSYGAWSGGAGPGAGAAAASVPRMLSGGDAAEGGAGAGAGAGDAKRRMTADAALLAVPVPPLHRSLSGDNADVGGEAVTPAGAAAAGAPSAAAIQAALLSKSSDDGGGGGVGVSGSGVSGTGSGVSGPVPEEEEGIQKHYNEVVLRQELVSKERQEEMMRVMFLASKKAAHKKNTKRIVNGSKIAVAAGAAVTAGVLTAGVGLAVGLVFVGITAAAGGGGAMAEANYLRTKGKTSMTLACRSLEEAQAWKDALEAVISRMMTPDRSQGSLLGMGGGIGGGSDLWSSLFARDGSTVPGAGARVRGLAFGGKKKKGGGGGAFESKSQRLAKKGGGGGGADRGGSGSGELYVDPETKWRPLEGGWVLLLGCGAHGLRICREERGAYAKSSVALGGRRDQVSVVGGICPPLRAHVTLSATPLNAFMCLMSHGRIDRDYQHQSQGRGGRLLDPPPVLTPNSCQRASFRIIETMDDHEDIIHLFFRPVYLFPSWTAPRDYVLFRYWRYDPDGTYMICLDSVKRADCPPVEGYVRGELHGVYTISPRKANARKGAGGGSSQGGHGEPECLLTSLVQVDPKGWVPTVPLSPLSNQSYAEAFGVSALLQLLDVRDALDHDRFVPVSMDERPLKPTWKAMAISSDGGRNGGGPQLVGGNNIHRNRSDLAIAATQSQADLLGASSSEMFAEEEDQVNYDFAYSTRELPHESDHVSVAATEPGSVAPRSLATYPDPLRMEWWAEPDSNSFRVRGKYYKTDRKKYNAGPSLFRLVATDIIETPENIFTAMCAHPTQRVQQSLLRGDLPPFIFCVNIALPGPPCYHMVYYFAVDDIGKIDGSDGTPSSKLAREFFFDGDDDFRDKTFKLIPQIVEGNFMVRKAVGCTPCIMGTKLKQMYLPDPSPEPRYYELLLDTGSDPIAKGVIRLCLGYSKNIVVDMAFLLEGNDESTLPERVMGCARLKEPDFTKSRFVEMP